MRPLNLRPCGMQRALSSCRPGTIRCTPFPCVIRGQRGLKRSHVANDDDNIASEMRHRSLSQGIN